jgi:hypothetical protein
MAFGQMITGFTEDQQRQILAALNNKKIRGCSACGLTRTWELITEGIINLPVGSAGLPGGSYQYYAAPIYPNRGMPCIGLMCKNCGHLQLHSVFQLGLGTVLGLLPSPIFSTGGQ